MLGIMPRLFSDELRWLKITVVLVAIGILGVANIYTGPRYSPGFRQFVKDLSRLEGQTRSLMMLKVARVTSQGVWIRSPVYPQPKLLVVGSFPGLKKDDIVSFTLKVAPGQTVTAVKYHRHRLRSGKFLISLIALIPVIIIWRWELKWDGQSRLFRRRARGE